MKYSTAFPAGTYYFRFENNIIRVVDTKVDPYASNLINFGHGKVEVRGDGYWHLRGTNMVDAALWWNLSDTAANDAAIPDLYTPVELPRGQKQYEYPGMSWILDDSIGMGPGESNTCRHEWIEAGFQFTNVVCKHCDIKKPGDAA